MVEEQVIESLQTDISELMKVFSMFSRQRIVIVTAEIGAGPAPEKTVERLFRMLLGTANCRFATMANTVIDVRCGIPMVIKET